MEVSAWLHTPANLSQRKESWYPLDVVRPQSQPGHYGEENNSVLAGIDLQSPNSVNLVTLITELSSGQILIQFKVVKCSCKGFQNQ
jgi:hypothetical protein